MRNGKTTFDPATCSALQPSSAVKKLTVYVFSFSLEYISHIPKVFDARQLPHSTKKDDEDIVDPYVILELVGVKKDYKIEKTPHISNNMLYI